MMYLQAYSSSPPSTPILQSYWLEMNCCTTIQSESFMNRFAVS